MCVTVKHDSDFMIMLLYYQLNTQKPEVPKIICMILWMFCNSLSNIKTNDMHVCMYVQPNLESGKKFSHEKTLTEHARYPNLYV